MARGPEAVHNPGTSKQIKGIKNGDCCSLMIVYFFFSHNEDRIQTNQEVKHEKVKYPNDE